MPSTLAPAFLPPIQAHCQQGCFWCLSEDKCGCKACLKDLPIAPHLWETHFGDFCQLLDILQQLSLGTEPSAGCFFTTIYLFLWEVSRPDLWC